MQVSKPTPDPFSHGGAIENIGPLNVNGVRGQRERERAWTGWVAQQLRAERVRGTCWLGSRLLRNRGTPGIGYFDKDGCKGERKMER
jgi:hypothetical protein